MRNPTRLHGTNFCTTLARFAPSFVRQPNGTKCTKIVRNASKYEFRSQQGQSGFFVAKNNDATSWHEFWHQFGSFCTKFCKATKRYQIHSNSTKHTKYMCLVSNGVDRVRSLQKIPTRLRGTNLCTSSTRFVLSFVRQPNGSECTQIVRNAPKHQFRVQWGGPGTFVAKNSDATSWHELLH